MILHSEAQTSHWGEGEKTQFWLEGDFELSDNSSTTNKTKKRTNIKYQLLLSYAHITLTPPDSVEPDSFLSTLYESLLDEETNQP